VRERSVKVGREGGEGGVPTTVSSTFVFVKIPKILSPIEKHFSCPHSFKSTFKIPVMKKRKITLILDLNQGPEKNRHWMEPL